MPISSKTPPTESAPIPTRSRDCPASSPSGAAVPQRGLPQPGLLQSGILDQLQDAVFTTDLQGIVTSCNPCADRYGLAPRERVGRNIADFYGVEQQTFLASRAIAVVLENGRFEGEFRGRTKSGRDVDVHLCLTLLRDANADPAGILGFSIEITGKSGGLKLEENAPSPVRGGVAAETMPIARR